MLIGFFLLFGMSLAQFLNLDLSAEAFPSLRNQCVDSGILSCNTPLFSAPTYPLCTGRDGPCPVQECSNERTNGYRGHFDLTHPIHGQTGVWVCKACLMKAGRTGKKVRTGEHMENKRVFSGFKALLYTVMLCAKNGGLVRRR